MAYSSVTPEQETKPSTGHKITVEKILEDFKRAINYLSPLHKAIEEDFKFVQGKQWDDEDIETLRKAGIKALTINKLKPIIKLLTGIERQSKSDFIALPEGDEDGIVADISSALLKNTVKNSSAEKKLSELFKRGAIGGVDYLEPYIDYSDNLIHGVMRMRNISPLSVFFDPDAKEHDLCDAKFIIKFSPDMCKEDLIYLFPDKEKVIEEISDGKVALEDIVSSKVHTQGLDYPSIKEGSEDYLEVENVGLDLIEYYYKSMVSKYFVVDPAMQTVLPVVDKKMAQEYVNQYPDAKLIEKKAPEIRCCAVIGNTIIKDETAWSFPKWKRFPIIPYFAEWITMLENDSVLSIQGVVRGIKDLQLEYNKRRTQELRHLNSTIANATLVPRGSMTPQDLERMKTHGSSPGFVAEFDASLGKPERMGPVPLSTAHAELALENAQDLKEASGVNPDLLASANSGQDQSGRAILLKQKQGLVMTQELMDNYSDTKKNLGKFLLSQLGEIYTVESAIKVCGNAFLEKYQEFRKPSVDETGMPIIDPMTGELKTEVDMEIVNQIFNKVLNDVELADYDVSIGEGAYSETIKMSNYLTLMDMVAKGLPIPPDVLVSESTLSQGSKEKIQASIQAQMQAQAQAMAMGQNMPPQGGNAGGKPAKGENGG